MSDYRRVSEALKSGADPAMLCATCPWDRSCLTPPSMSSEDIEREIAIAKAKDEDENRKRRSEGKDGSIPMGLLMTSMIYSGKDTAATVCPVFVARLRSSQGRTIADSLKSTMQGWNDDL